MGREFPHPQLRFWWRCVALSQFSPILICHVYAPHVGMPLPDRLAFWAQFRAAVQEMLVSHPLQPHARFILAGDSKWLA